MGLQIGCSTQVLQLYQEAFGLEPSFVSAISGSMEGMFEALPDAQEGGSTSAPSVQAASQDM